MRQNSRALELGVLGLVLICAALLRWYGLAWDSGYLFHPDERQIVMIVSRFGLPSNLSELVTPASPLNPAFFSYGSFPLYLLWLVKPLAPPTHILGPWADDQLASWALLGRALSGLFDLGTIVLTYALGRRAYSGKVGLVAAACVAFTVLHIQLSHFYAVDTLLTFFTVGTLYCAFRIAQTTMQGGDGKNRADRARGWVILCGVAFGLALATKITALLLVVPIGVACYYLDAARTPVRFSRSSIGALWRSIRRPLLTILGIAALVSVVTQPYVLVDWYTFGRDVVREALVARGWLDYPYTRQYAATTPVVYPLVQSTLWAMGIPLGIAAWLGAALFVGQWWRGRDWRDTLLLAFALLYSVAIALQYAKYLRYLLPLLPILYIIAAAAWSRALAGHERLLAAGTVVVLVAALVYSVAFVQLYSREHPWLTASRWMYENIPPGKSLMVEAWDDALPTLIEFPNGARRASDYAQTQFPMYDEDSVAKRNALAAQLAKTDYVVLASQRLYGSIARLPERYPMTTRYYEKLFDGELGFEPIMTARNDPNLFGVTLRDDPLAGLPFNRSRVDALLAAQDDSGWVWNLGYADESYSVYDHPQPIVLQKKRALSAQEIAERLE